MRFVFLRSHIHTTGEGELHNVQLIFQKLVNDFDHALYRHGFFGDDQAAFGVSSGQFCLERRPFHHIVRGSVFDALLFVDGKYRRQQGIILPQDQGVVEIFQNFPGGLLDLVAGKYHVDARIDRAFYFDGENSGVSVKILGFAFEAVKTVGVLQIKCCDASHGFISFIV